MNSKSPEQPNQLSLGQTLSQARQKAELDLYGLSELTRLPINVLEALEKDDFKHLPARPYVKAFLVTLGKSLKIENNLLLNLYEKNSGIKTVREEKITQLNDNKSRPPQKISKKVLGLILVGIFFLLIIISSLLSPRKNDKEKIIVQEEETTGAEIEPQPETKKRVKDSVKMIKEIKDSLPVSTKDTVIKIKTVKKTDPKPVKKNQVLKKIIPKKDPLVHEKNPISTITKKKPIEPEVELKKPKPTPAKPLNFVPKNRVKFTCLADSVWLIVEKVNLRSWNKMMYKGNTWFFAHTDTIKVKTGVKKGLEVAVNGKPHIPAKRNYFIVNNILVE